jgi:hypothetical protein
VVRRHIITAFYTKAQSRSALRLCISRISSTIVRVRTQSAVDSWTASVAYGSSRLQSEAVAGKFLEANTSTRGWGTVHYLVLTLILADWHGVSFSRFSGGIYENIMSL